MTSRESNDERWLCEFEATDFLRRASERDAGEVVELRHLRETPPVWVRCNLAGTYQSGRRSLFCPWSSPH